MQIGEFVEMTIKVAKNNKYPAVEMTQFCRKIVWVRQKLFNLSVQSLVTIVTMSPSATSCCRPTFAASCFTEGPQIFAYRN